MKKEFVVVLETDGIEKIIDGLLEIEEREAVDPSYNINFYFTVNKFESGKVQI